MSKDLWQLLFIFCMAFALTGLLAMELTPTCVYCGKPCQPLPAVKWMIEGFFGGRCHSRCFWKEHPIPPRPSLKAERENT